MLVIRLLKSTLPAFTSSLSRKGTTGMFSTAISCYDTQSYTPTITTGPYWLIPWVVISRYRSFTDFTDSLWVMMCRHIFLVFIKNWYSYISLLMGWTVRHSSYWIWSYSILTSTNSHFFRLVLSMMVSII